MSAVSVYETGCCNKFLLLSILLPCQVSIMNFREEMTPTSIVQSQDKKGHRNIMYHTWLFYSPPSTYIAIKRFYVKLYDICSHIISGILWNVF